MSQTLSRVSATIASLLLVIPSTQRSTRRFEPKLPCGKYSGKYNAHAPKGRPSKFLFLPVKSPHNKNIIHSALFCTVANLQLMLHASDLPCEAPGQPYFSSPYGFFKQSPPWLCSVEAQLVDLRTLTRQTMQCPTDSSTTSLLRRSRTRPLGFFRTLSKASSKCGRWAMQVP